MKVLQLIDSLEVGGAEMLAVNIANNLDRKGIKSFLCATRKEGPLKNKISNRKRYLFMNKKRKIDFFALSRLILFIKRNKIDIIHAHSSSYFTACLIKMFCFNVKIFWHDHFGNSEYLNHRKYKFLRIASLLFSGIISVNKKLREWSLKNLLCKNVIFINNFAFLDEANDSKTILKGENGKRLVHLAGFREQKDHINLLESFKIVSKVYPDWSLHLIGKDWEDNYSKSIHKFIENNKMTKNVFTYGVCSDIKNILSQSTIGVLSSKSEGLPVALLEYASVKLPVVVTDVGECKAIVNGLNKSFIVPPNNSIAFSDSLKNLISLSIRDRAILGEELFKLVSKDYSIDNFLNNIVYHYNKAIIK